MTADWLLKSVSDFAEYVSSAEKSAAQDGVLQGIDPRFKIIGFLTLILSVVFTRSLISIAVVFAFALALSVASGIKLHSLARWVWLPVLAFTGLIALPAVFMVPGGLRSASLLVARAETASYLSALLAMTTPWTRIIKALQVLKTPIVFVVILGSTYRYLFVLLEAATDLSDSRRSRTVGMLEPKERRRIAAATAGVLLSKSLQMSGEVHQAMLSRGFRGELFILDDFILRRSDWMWLGVFWSVAAAAVYAGI